MTLDQFFITSYIQTALSGIVAAAAFMRFTSRSMVVKLVGCSFLLGFVCNAVAIFLYNTYPQYSNIPQTLYFIFNFLIISALFYNAFQGQYRVWIFIALAVCIPFSFYDAIILKKNFLDSYSPFAKSFFSITFSVLYFYKLMVDMPAVHLHRLPMFWFNSAFLFFNAGTLFLYAFTGYLIHVLHNDMLAYWSFHNSLSILEHIIILVGLFFDFKAHGTDSHVHDVAN